MLAEREWDEVAHFCSYHRQYQALNLLPWQSPPAWIGDPDEDLSRPQHRTEGRHEAALLTKKMLALGISRYHPDPVGAIQAAQKTKR